MNTLQISNSVFGMAITDYFESKKPSEIEVISEDFDDDFIPVEYLFRTYEDWPEIEKIAINRCEGKILEIGSLTGVHAEYLKEKGYDVTCCEMDPIASDFIEKKGYNIIKNDIFLEKPIPIYDYVLIMMNGLGILEKIEMMEDKLNHLLNFLKPGGKIISDSSYLDYLEEHKTDRYFGEFEYQITYKGYISPKFNWLYIDYSKLKEKCKEFNLKCELLAYNEEDHHFLVEISRPI